MVWAPSAVPTGTVTAMPAPPPVGTAAGVARPETVPASVGPAAESRWNVMVSASRNPAIVPDSVAGSDVTVVDDVMVREGGPTDTAALCALSAPCHPAFTGWTVYFHVPVATPDSLHDNPETVPA